MLRLAGSLARDIPVSLRDALAGLDPLTELPGVAAGQKGLPEGSISAAAVRGHVIKTVPGVELGQIAAESGQAVRYHPLTLSSSMLLRAAAGHRADTRKRP